MRTQQSQKLTPALPSVARVTVRHLLGLVFSASYCSHWDGDRALPEGHDWGHALNFPLWV